MPCGIGAIAEGREHEPGNFCTCILSISFCLKPCITLQQARHGLLVTNLQDDVDDVVVVGGSSRLPRIRVDLETFFSTSVLHMADQTINADEAVAIGAAVTAARIAGGPSSPILGPHIVDAVAQTVGIQYGYERNMVRFHLLWRIWSVCLPYLLHMQQMAPAWQCVSVQLGGQLSQDRFDHPTHHKKCRRTN